MHRITQFAIVAIGILFASLAWAAPLVAANKNEICHLHRNVGLFEWLIVGGRSAVAHQAHGDCKVDDGVPCTVDRCDENDGCVSTADNSLCEDGNGCTTNICNLNLGCQSTAVVDGTPCSGGVCDDGVCVPCAGGSCGIDADCCPPHTCGGGGTPSVCGCTSDCAGKGCGDDGCGGSCGDCDLPQSCIEGICGCPTGITALGNGSFGVPCCVQADCAALACECRASSDGSFCATGLTVGTCTTNENCPLGSACFSGQCTLLCQQP